MVLQIAVLGGDTAWIQLFNLCTNIWKNMVYVVCLIYSFYYASM